MPDMARQERVRSLQSTSIHTQRRWQSSGENTMLQYAVIFFIIAIIAAVFGFGGIAAGAAGIAKILFFIFVVIFLVTLLMGAIRR
jgi:uncharacterized membrane protein YtjA (UPF0391 family)